MQAYLEDYLDYLIAIDRLNDKDDNVVSCDELMELVGLQDEHKSSVTVCRSTVMAEPTIFPSPFFSSPRASSQ